MKLTIKNCFSWWFHKRALVAAALICILLCSCGQDERNDNMLRIGVVLYDQDDTFINTIYQELEQMAQETEAADNIKIKLSLADSHSNQTAQLEQIDRLLDLKCDVLCVNIVDRTTAAVIADKAKDADVPIIFFNRQPVKEDILRWDKIFYVGTDAAQGGTLQGELVLDAWKNDPDLDLNGDTVLQYAMLEGEAGHQDTLLRTEYCVKTLVDAGVRVEKVAGATANWNRAQGCERVEQWLEQIDTDIEVIFSNNDDMALGAIDALTEAGISKMPLIVGVDATQPALKSVSEGTLYGTVLNDGKGIAKAMLDLSITLCSDTDLSNAVALEEDHYVWLASKAITKENLSDYFEY